MKRIHRQAALYRDTAMESLTLAIELFNRPSPVGRSHTVPSLLGHCFEMILKALIFQKRGSVRDPKGELSYSLEKCINIAADDLGLVTQDERVLLSVVKQNRDTAAHDSISMSEELMWIQMRAGITIVRRLLCDEFNTELTDLLPGRIIPVAVDPLPDLAFTVEQELAVVKSYLAPKTRKTAEARALL